MTRALLRDAAQARRAVIVGCTQASMELSQRLALHVELGISVAGFFDDRGSDRLGCSKARAAARAVSTTLRHSSTHRNIDVIFIAIAAGAAWRACASWCTSSATPRRPSTSCPMCRASTSIQQRASEILGMPVVAMCETPFHGYRGLVKRLMDVTIATSSRWSCWRRCC